MRRKSLPVLPATGREVAPLVSSGGSGGSGGRGPKRRRRRCGGGSGAGRRRYGGSRRRRQQTEPAPAARLRSVRGRHIVVVPGVLVFPLSVGAITSGQYIRHSETGSRGSDPSPIRVPDWGDGGTFGHILSIQAKKSGGDAAPARDHINGSVVTG